MRRFPGRRRAQPDGRGAATPTVAPERTALAWQRTAIAATVALVPTVVVDLRLGARALVALDLLATVLAAGLVLGVDSRVRQLEPAPSGSPWGTLWRVAAVTALAGAAGLSTVPLLLLR